MEERGGREVEEGSGGERWEVEERGGKCRREVGGGRGGKWRREVGGR